MNRQDVVQPGGGGGGGPREKAAAGSVSPFKKSAGLDVFEMEK